MAFPDVGLNFRMTAGFVTDGANEDWIGDGTDHPYPTTVDTVDLGWEVNPTDSADRDSGADPRLAGIVYKGNDGVQATFRVDLDATGAHDIHLALGDHGGGQAYQYLQFQDGTTPFATIDKSAGTAANQWYDATGTLRTSEADWVSNETLISHTFTSTILRVVIGAPSAQTQSSTLAHLRIVQGAAAGPVAQVITTGV